MGEGRIHRARLRRHGRFRAVEDLGGNGVEISQAVILQRRHHAIPDEGDGGGLGPDIALGLARGADIGPQQHGRDVEAFADNSRASLLRSLAPISGRWRMARTLLGRVPMKPGVEPVFCARERACASVSTQAKSFASLESVGKEVRMMALAASSTAGISRVQTSPA